MGFLLHLNARVPCSEQTERIRALYFSLPTSGASIGRYKRRLKGLSKVIGTLLRPFDDFLHLFYRFRGVGNVISGPG